MNCDNISYWSVSHSTVAKDGDHMKIIEMDDLQGTVDRSCKSNIKL